MSTSSSRVSGKRLGRPEKWPALLRLVQSGGAGSFGPYLNQASAVANASYFNAQMRSLLPSDYEEYRFRARGGRIFCFTLDELRGGP